MKSIIKGAGYILVHTPDMVIHNGTTQTTERVVNPESEYLKELPEHIRSFEDTLSYYPNQVYIGNVTPDALAAVPQPWHDKKCPETSRFGQFGQIMPQEEFLLLMQACDVFDLVKLDAAFVAAHKAALAATQLWMRRSLRASAKALRRLRLRVWSHKSIPKGCITTVRSWAV